MRLALAAVLLLALLPPVPAASPASGFVTDLVLLVDGEPAHGLVAWPTEAPLALVVIAHGYGHKAESHRGHLQHLADNGYLAVAMDYRGEGMPLRAGADDTLAATRGLLDEASARGSPIDRVVLYSVSMGTAVASMVLSEGDGLYDQWVNNEGLAMLHETWAGASLLAPSGNPTAVGAVADIEAECGGTPAQQPACYLERSAATRAHEWTWLQGAVLVHGLNDGLVPYDQGREMLAALRANGVPADFYTVARCSGEGTTLTGHAGQGGQGVCGHGTESLDGHFMTELSFDLLDQVLSGQLRPALRERVVDGGATVA